MCFQKHSLEALQVLYLVASSLLRSKVLSCPIVADLIQKRNHNSTIRNQPKGGGTIIFR